MWELSRSLVQARESTHAAYITSTTLLGCTVKRKNMLTFILFHTIYSQAIASDCCEMSEVVRCLVICADFCVWKSSVCNVERDMCIKKKRRVWRSSHALHRRWRWLAEFIADQVTHNSAATGNERRSETAFMYYIFIYIFFRPACYTYLFGCCVLLAGRVSVIAAVAVMPFRLESHIMHLNTLTEAAAETRRHTATWSTF